MSSEHKDLDEIDYEKLKTNVRNTVRTIEEKPHVRYIRYLLSKRISPAMLRQELYRAGLSSPHEPNLTAYYISVIDPLITKHGLGNLYCDFKNKLLKRNTSHGYVKGILNYTLHLGDNLDDQVKFCSFIKELEVDSLWIKEIFRHHGSTDRMPIDANGERILKVNAPSKSVDAVLVSPKRYLIDKLILENVSEQRISDYCIKELKIPVQRQDVALYKQMFFNIKTHVVEDKIKALESEKGLLEVLLKDLDNLSAYDDMEIGEKLAIKRQVTQRISEFDDNIKTLNMYYSEFAFKKGTSEHVSFEDMFKDIVERGYNRFKSLDTYKDRDVVEPMVKIIKVMTSAHDKMEGIRSSAAGCGDKHSQTILMELYKQRTEDIISEQLERANKELESAGISVMSEHILAEDIAGIEDLGVSFEVNSDEDDSE